MINTMQVPQESLSLAKPGQLIHSHLLGLDPDLTAVSGTVLQYCKSNGQEVDGDEAGKY